ncbi:hypothetical protein AGABI2DRAFT_144061 [Agaricus bisporus var. bisporus H97]|uniref:hypothetical protein n=1 Tax=Agaricus bisporus var. bisporus (strain H97 / ATCC MYA-4626 / FGSC 10389) TaxID=936046 RepID=UPI00029F61E8|nr:hypothetical protein AGABI2DRAFT_144061 [Agaricus bisporus var. bisporus H97]EKV45664.1 hypothetical protein AGABI2DRAFT_144061 [Agaricus bisporus var. bisporus H97]
MYGPFVLKKLPSFSLPILNSLYGGEALAVIKEMDNVLARLGAEYINRYHTHTISHFLVQTAVNQDFFLDRIRHKPTRVSNLLSSPLLIGVDNDKRLSERKSNAFPPPPPWGKKIGKRQNRRVHIRRCLAPIDEGSQFNEPEGFYATHSFRTFLNFASLLLLQRGSTNTHTRWSIDASWIKPGQNTDAKQEDKGTAATGLNV